MLTADDLASVEGDALLLHERAGIGPEDRPGGWLLAKILLKREPELTDMRFLSKLVTVNGAPRIFVNERIPEARARFQCGHELAHWLWGLPCTGSDPTLEARADALGAALDVPRQALARARREVGDNPRRLARELETTQSLALLRLGEVVGTPVALVARVVRVRGDEWGWPNEPELRGLAKTKRLPRELQRVAINDEPARVGLVARIA